MKALPVLILTTSFGFLWSAGAQENDTSIVLRPDSGSITMHKSFTIVFPEAMIPAGHIDRGAQESPLVFSPTVQGDFTWKSQTEGRFYVTGPLRPGSTYFAGLRKGLKTLEGKPTPTLTAKFETAPLTVRAKYSRWGDALPQKPVVRLLFNYEVNFKASQNSIYLQDRDTRERFDVALILPYVNAKSAEQHRPVPESGTDVQAEPVKPLPAGRKIDLIIDGLRDAPTGTPIAHLEVFELGRTRLLQIREIKAYGSALVKPHISITPSTKVDIDTITAESISVHPPVPNLKRLGSRYQINLEGDFDLTETYTVSINPPLKAASGFPLEASFTKSVEFARFLPSIYFPSQQFFQRSALGLNVKYLHANTREVRWQLAPIPDHKLTIVQKRLASDKELVLESLGLEPLASGKQPGTSEIEAVYRDIQWKPEADQPMLSGAYLLEVSTPVSDGEIAAHRAVIFFNDIILTRKDTRDEVLFKLTRMEDVAPVADAKVRIVLNDNRLRRTTTSDAEGIVRIPRTVFTQKPHVSHLLVDSSAGKAVQFSGLSRFPNSGYSSSSTSVRTSGSMVMDRNLYRPGSTAKFKGIVRMRDVDGNLSLPRGSEVRWKVTTGYRGETLAEATSKLDSHGGWEGEWEVPADQKLGSYQVTAHLIGYSSAGRAWFRVEEYRTPLFEVELSDESMAGPVARVRVQSNYFHGSPNAGARVMWEAVWYPSDGPPYDGFARHDSYSENPPPAPQIEPASGELSLNEDGTAYIELPVPVKKPWTHSIFRYDLTVNVTSPEGRTITNGLYESQIVIPRAPGISMSANYDEGPAVDIVLNTLNAERKHVDGEPMTVELWNVTARTVKEKLAPRIYRYRNFDEFEIIEVHKAKSGKDPLRMKVEKPGRYVARASLDGNPDAPWVSQRVTVAGEKPVPYPVYNSTTFAIKTDKEKYNVGDTAALALEAPFGGKAWVSIETGKILDQFVVDVPVNATRIDVPIKKDYFPNAWASIYLVKPGGPDHLPSERMGRVRLSVERPDIILDIEPSLEKPEVEPGKPVVGTVFVSAGGKPVADADLTVIAVDEAVLKLGQWSVPDLIHEFYPYRSHHVATYQALRNHFESFDESDVVEKGVLIGGGGEASRRQQQKTRKNFVARAFWKTQLRTDAEGRASFDFAAPDNLTAFRVTAVGHTKEHQFGHGYTTLTVAKRLMIEPALPRFVRHGDDLIIRAVVRQSALDEAPVSVRCSTKGGLTLLPAEPMAPVATQRDVPVVFRFPARVTSYEPAVVRFESSVEGNSDIGDAVEITLPVHAPGILQKTGRYGKAPEGQRFVLANQVPDFWPEAQGKFSLTLSHSKWIPKLTGLPVILDYPHGCFEQKSSRYLGYTLLAGLLDFLPDVQGRHENYAQRISEGLAEFERNLIDRYLPYWPGGSRHIHVTILGAWVTANAKKAGIKIPARLAAALPRALDDIIRGRTEADINDRCFALFVYGENGGAARHTDVMRDIYLNREKMSDEGRAFLAIAMRKQNVLPNETAQLMRELAMPLKPHAFDPETFYSTTRAEAVRFLAKSRVGGEAWAQGPAKEARERLLTMLDSSFNLSTQENLWLLVAFKAMHDAEEFATFDKPKFHPDRVSRNKVSVSWKERGLEKIREMEFFLGKPDPVYYLVDAEVLREGENMEREHRGLRVERVVKNLTDPKRLGTKKAPFKIGDEVYITYRFSTDRNHYYAALTDELPAALETVNFNLAQVAEFYELPKAEDSVLYLDHSELRDRSANLYFNRMRAGEHVYSILARVTSVGRFTWPSATITPMYEPRFGGLSAPQPCYVIE